MDGDFIVVSVDRKITPAACIGKGENGVGVDTEDGGVQKDEIFKGNGGDGVSSFSSVNAKGCVRECRICQEEDMEKDMETPCACNGTLKFAHRKCIQRWCNKKGDITCEICHQIFSPNYTCPPPRSNSEVLTIDIRQAWESHIDIGDTRLLALAAAERPYFRSIYEDYDTTDSQILGCLPSIAVIFMLLLLIHQILMVTRDFHLLQKSSAFENYQVSALQLMGFVLPCYVVARSWYAIQCRRMRQVY